MSTDYYQEYISIKLDKNIGLIEIRTYELPVKNINYRELIDLKEIKCYATNFISYMIHMVHDTKTVDILFGI
mgnify:CR=1 FL=1|jgi:hypothetical protein